MMARRGVMGFLAGVATLALAGCGLLFPNKYRFRMTVEVETPGGVRTGTSVYEVKAGNSPKLLPEERSRAWTVTGEAVAVDLPGGKTLFTLLKTVNPMRDDLAKMSMAALDPAFNNDIVESAQRIASGNDIRSPTVIAPSDYPILVAFGDIGDPKSVGQVNPTNLAATFGPGIRLKAITVEVTDDAVSTGIEKRLGWLRDEGLTLDPAGGPTISPTFAQAIRQREFSTEIGK